MEMNKVAKNRQKFYCKKCNYTCSKLSDWNKHNATRKHNMEINGNNGKIISPIILSCEKCNKIFKSNSGLWKHKKCSFEETKEAIEIKEDIDYKLLLLKMMEQNNELQNTIITFYNN